MTHYQYPKRACAMVSIGAAIVLCLIVALLIHALNP